MPEINIGPQEGPQTDFFKTEADIAIFGGGGGGGKSWALLFEPMRHYEIRGFRSLTFRRTTREIRMSGGLWDESYKMYSLVKGFPKETTLEWNFNTGARFQFAHLEHENDVYSYQGAQIPLIMFDELTHFTEKQFFYMLSRNRSDTGIKGYMRGTCNPDPDSWVAKFISWWVDQDTGKAIKERSGVLRWFIRSDDEIVWADSKEELLSKFGEDCEPYSVTFIPATVYDNKILLKKDPAYIAKLKALPRIDRERLLDANWKIRPAAGIMFKKIWFEIVDAIPSDIVKQVRAWDKAATEVNSESPLSSDPDWTTGLKLVKDKKGIFYVVDVIRERLSVKKVEDMILNTAKRDTINCKIKLFQDPGSAGVYEAKSYINLLSGFDVETEKIIKDKITASKPVSAQCEHGNVKILRAKWNDVFLNELEAFPEVKHDDQVDALSSAFNELNAYNVGDFNENMVQNESVTSINLNGGPLW